ncbi:hypothetical protein J4480_03725 [Candidatus Woesearchaeota archaeon]|nr:hypothetical protein [Candidatus Woesearchaeota archaeon]
MKKINKKGEFVVLSFILLISLIAGIYIIQQQLEKKDYLGDSSTMVVYNLSSTNPNCSQQEIRIDMSNLKLFSTFEEANKLGFRLDEVCR